MMYNVKVDNCGAAYETVVTTPTEIAAVAEAVVRSMNGGFLPKEDAPGGEFYLNWQTEMLEFESVEDLKMHLFDQRIIIDVRKGL